jgi:hypothetical protein
MMVVTTIADGDADGRGGARSSDWGKRWGKNRILGQERRETGLGCTREGSMKP